MTDAISDPLFWHRLQFGFTITFHYIFPQLTMGLALLVVVLKAVALLAHQAFDVALLDVHMPGADGMALARTLRNLPHPPSIVFVTAHAEHAVQAFEIEAVTITTPCVGNSRGSLQRRRTSISSSAT